MKFFQVAFFAAGLVTAQSGGLSECAQGCLTEYTSGSNIADCQRFDISCICNNSGFIDGIACCLANNCSESDQSDAVQYAAEICGAEGINMPTAVTCSSLATSTTTDSTEATGSITSDTPASESTNVEDSESQEDAESDAESDATADNTTKENVGLIAAPASVGIFAAGILGAIAMF